jgi:AbiV family abortive infection protein
MNDAPTPTPNQQLAPDELGVVNGFGGAASRPAPASIGRRADATDIIASISRRLSEKSAPSRIGSGAAAVTVLDDPGLTSGTTDEVVGQWIELFGSTEQLWDAAAQLWRGGFSAPATALAVVTLEETAKLADEGLRVATVKPDATPARGRRRPPHEQQNKQVLVAVHGALANGRINRYLGAVQVNDFLGLVERGELDGLRQSCLYAARGVGGPSMPRDAVTRDRAAWIVALAGEVLAEIHFEPGEWGRVLAKVDAFERAAGIRTAGTDGATDHALWTAIPPSGGSIRREATG